MAGKVQVDTRVIDKPGTLIDPNSDIKIQQDDNPYVSRGGLKLEKALKSFPIDVSGFTCLDIGASTGGFTDCLLKHGAKKVFSVDVGYGQLDWSLRTNDKVVVIERTNIRHMPFEAVNQNVDLIVADTSFISLKKVIPAAEQFMRQGTQIIALIKPQFEAGKDKIQKGGIVKDSAVKKAVKADLTQFFKENGYKVNQIIPSPILGAKGNEEFIISLNFLKNEK